MAQMRVQLTSPYGSVTRTFSEFDRDVVTTDDGTVLVIFDVLKALLEQAEDVEYRRQGQLITFTYDESGEPDFYVTRENTALGFRSLITSTVSAQDPGLFEIADPDNQLLEIVGYDLSDLPFEVTIEDVTGQLYDEYKEGAE